MKECMLLTSSVLILKWNYLNIENMFLLLMKQSFTGASGKHFSNPLIFKDHNNTWNLCVLK